MDTNQDDDYAIRRSALSDEAFRRVLMASIRKATEVRGVGKSFTQADLIKMNAGARPGEPMLPDGTHPQRFGMQHSGPRRDPDGAWVAWVDFDRMAQKIPRWIPVGESMPDDMQDVLVTDVQVLGDYDSIEVIKATFVEEKRDFCIGEGLYCWHAVAWMPLPEPYQEKK